MVCSVLGLQIVCHMITEGLWCQVHFRLHANKSAQLKAWNAGTKAYSPLPSPRCGGH